MLAAAAAGLVLLSRFYHNMSRNACVGNLHEIGLALIMYADHHGGNFPDSFKTLVVSGETQGNVFVCPATDDTAAQGSTPAIVADRLTQGGHLSYVYVGRGLTLSTASDRTVLAYEPLSNHGDGMNVVFGDCHIEWLAGEAARKLQDQAAAGLLPIMVDLKESRCPECGTAAE